MTPEERHQDAIEAAKDWRDAQRLTPPGLRRCVWIDTGSGPGIEVPAPPGRPGDDEEPQK